MANAKKRVCLVCGKTYEFCIHCDDKSKLTPWKNVFHSENCVELMNVASDFKQGVITKDEARERFDSLDLSNKENFRAGISDAINEVYGDSKKAVIDKVENSTDDVDTSKKLKFRK